MVENNINSNGELARHESSRFNKMIEDEDPEINEDGKDPETSYRAYEQEERNDSVKSKSSGFLGGIKDKYNKYLDERRIKNESSEIEKADKLALEQDRIEKQIEFEQKKADKDLVLEQKRVNISEAKAKLKKLKGDQFKNTSVGQAITTFRSGAGEVWKDFGRYAEQQQGGGRSKNVQNSRHKNVQRSRSGLVGGEGRGLFQNPVTIEQERSGIRHQASNNNSFGNAGLRSPSNEDYAMRGPGINTSKQGRVVNVGTKNQGFGSSNALNEFSNTGFPISRTKNKKKKGVRTPSRNENASGFGAGNSNGIFTGKW